MDRKKINKSDHHQPNHQSNHQHHHPNHKQQIAMQGMSIKEIKDMVEGIKDQ